MVVFFFSLVVLFTLPLIFLLCLPFVRQGNNGNGGGGGGGGGMPGGVAKEGQLNIYQQVSSIFGHARFRNGQQEVIVVSACATIGVMVSLYPLGAL